MCSNTDKLAKCKCNSCSGFRDGICGGCGRDTFKIKEYYLVTNSLWEAADAPLFAFLCVGCLEGRLGFKLEPTNFPDFPINKKPSNEYSARLRRRMGL